jgi:hypothetical protein
MIKNDETDCTIVEEVNFPKFDGLSLVAPEEGDSYKMEVPPGEQKIVMVKGALEGYSLRMTYTSQLYWGEESLIEQCVTTGQQKVRGDDITQYSMQHTGGIIFVYKNDSTDKILKEEIIFDVDGLKVEGQDDLKVIIELGPSSQEVVKLRTTGGPWSFGCSCAYGVEAL